MIEFCLSSIKNKINNWMVKQRVFEINMLNTRPGNAYTLPNISSNMRGVSWFYFEFSRQTTSLSQFS